MNFENRLKIKKKHFLTGTKQLFLLYELGMPPELELADQIIRSSFHRNLDFPIKFRDFRISKIQRAMRKIALVFSLLPFYLLAQNPQLDWVSSTDGPDNCDSRGIHLDTNGDVYSVGSFFGDVDFDSSEETASLIWTSEAGFLQKLNADGEFLWVRGFGFQEGSELTCVAVETDAESNVYVVGDFFGSADLDPGDGEEIVVSEEGDRNSFIVKLNSDGDYIWSRVFFSDQDCNVFDLNVSLSGRVILVGEFQGSIDLNPGEEIEEFTSQDFTDGYVVELNTEGDYVNSMVFANDQACRVECVEIDSNENLFLAGAFSNTVDFDPGDGVSELSSAGGSDVFISKLNSNNELVWTRHFGGETTDNVKDLVVDAFGAVVTTGYFRQVSDFDPGEGVFEVAAAGVSGQPDGFVHKLDAQGNFVWAYTYGGVSFDEGNGLALDIFNDVYMNGRYAALADFLPGDEVLELDAPGSADAFVLALDGNDGSLKYVSPLAASGGSRMGELDIDNTGALFVSGRFGGMADFDPSTANSSNTMAVSTADHFNWKLSQCVLDTTISLEEGTLLAAEIPGATYQWFECDDPAVLVDGATELAFTPVEDGFYFVEVSLEDCVVSSECLEVSSLSVQDPIAQNSIEMFPNPANQLVKFSGEGIQSVELFDMTGKQVLSSPLQSIDITSLRPGIYLVRIQQENQNSVKRLVIAR